MMSGKADAAIVLLTPAQLDEATEVLVRAFRPTPLMRYLFGDHGARYDDALRGLFRFSCLVRYELDWALVGATIDGTLAGVMGITGPGEADWPDSLAAIYDEFKALIGPEAATRFER